MPVWHERTRDLVAAGRLAVLGITQEQHPARCRLFAQWHGIDWPILWDPFNLTGSKAVPGFTLVDVHGVVRVARARPDDLDAFLATSFDAPEVDRSAAPPTKAGTPPDVLAPGLVHGSAEARAIGALLFGGADRYGPDLATLGGLLEEQDPGTEDDPARAARHFRYGVALRMRYDDPAARPDDFARALEHWFAALALRPDQYIWRRRIQQYGPRPDKPYPFYDWVERARTDLRARGEVPVPLPVPLTETERGVWRLAAAEEREPDPQGRVPSDGAQALVRIDAAVAWSTAGGRPAARVHLRVALLDPERASFDAGQSIAGWVRAPEGDGWQVAHHHLAASIPPGARAELGARESVTVEVDVGGPQVGGPQVGGPSGGGDVALEGYLLVPLCIAADGRCVLVRRTFSVPLRAPPR